MGGIVKRTWFSCAGLRVGGCGGWDREKCALLGTFVLNMRDGVRKALGTKNTPLRVCFLSQGCVFCAQCEE